jgi:hypothetical protein
MLQHGQAVGAATVKSDFLQDRVIGGPGAEPADVGAEVGGHRAELIAVTVPEHNSPT